MPVPFDIFVPSSTVGLTVVPQHTPRVVTDSPPSSVTVPPLVADVDEVPVETVVIMYGTPLKVNAITLLDLGMSITTEV